MNARRVAAAEGVILAAMKNRVTAAGIAVALESACLLQSPESAAELARLRSLLAAQPLDLTEEQRDALSDAGNRALNDHYHADLCFCREWPESCVTRGYFPGMWDTGAFDIGLGAVLGLWESMRADAASAEVTALRSRVAELEAERHSTNEALDDAVKALRVQRDRIAELEAEQATAIAERDAQIVAWLGKKAREYGESDRESRAKAEAVWRMADKISRGAVRPALPLQTTTATAGSAL
ncbi:hypothetical protein [Nonomuraea sp. NPDC001636]|uniref:hypothetical protein n=1 Tax=Actinomycetes TaxID=1760 RepID=UPI003322812C